MIVYKEGPVFRQEQIPAMAKWDALMQTTPGVRALIVATLDTH